MDRVDRDLHARDQCFREKERGEEEREKKAAVCSAVDIQGACTNLTKHDGLHDGSYKKFISEE